MRYGARNNVCNVHWQTGQITMYFAFDSLAKNLYFYLFLIVHVEGSGNAHIEVIFTVGNTVAILECH